MGFSVQHYPDGRMVMHATPRKRGLVTQFTALDDDQTDATKIGGGSSHLAKTHTTAGANSYYFDLNTIINETHIHSGCLQWKDALNDEVKLEVVPQVTASSAGTGTNYNLYGGYLIIPAAGNGTLTVADGDRKLVQVPMNEFGNRQGAGYWDATFNQTTKLFENIIPNLTGTGEYNMFSVEVPLDRFGNRIPVLGTGAIFFQSHDASMLGHGNRLKITATGVGADHTWMWNLTLVLFRKRTV